jgi:IS1 family transposase
MNKLPLETRIQILSMLCEGSSMWAISRVCDVSINSVSKLLVDAGNACAAFHVEKVVGVKARRAECDEIWSFCYSKQSNTPSGHRGERGDVWTWTALDAESKLIISWMVGGRDADTAQIFTDDLKSRLANRVQLTTDGHRAYLDAVEKSFGGDVDYAMLVKLYGKPEGERGSAERKYSPAPCIGARMAKISGAPNAQYISTSYTERHNLTMRMSMRRFGRLTNAFSKKIDNHIHALSLYFVWYNWVRLHKSTRVTPAMAAGLTDKVMDMADVVLMIDAYQASRKEVAWGGTVHRILTFAAGCIVVAGWPVRRLKQAWIK